MREPAIQAENLGKRFRLGVGAGGYDTLREALARAIRPKSADMREIWALRGVDLEVPQGEALGIVGHNGAGKTTLLRILARITNPSEGVARTRGAVGSLLDVGTGFHPELTGRENVYLSGTVLGMRRVEIRKRFDEIVDFSGIERFLDTPVKRYSEGMRLRLAFAVAAHLEPPIVVVDEVLAVGDSAFREKCMGKMAELGQRERTVLFVSHDLSAITRLCARAIWLDAGRVKSDGPASDVVAAYLARVTPKQLLDAEYEDHSAAAAVVSRVTVRDGATREILATPLRTQSLTIEIAIEVREPIRDLDVSLIVIDENGTVIIDDAVRDGSVDADRALPGDPGTYKFAATIPPLLHAGKYMLRTWIGNIFDYVERDLMSIDVAAWAGDTDESTARRRAVQPQIDWKVSRESDL